MFKVTAVPGAVLDVPGAFPTIQAAIHAAANGDEVVLAPGAYSERINFNSKSIILRGSGGAAVTTIDGGGLGPTVTVTSVSAPAALEGLTITGGVAPPTTSGGGVRIANSTFAIRACVIRQNRAVNGGGAGLYATGANLTVTLTDFIENSATSTGSGIGGGLSGQNSTLLMTTSRFFRNVANGIEGGGVAVSTSGTTTLRDCVFDGNRSTEASGGGIYLAGSGSTSIENVQFTSNVAEAASGAGLFSSSSGTLTVTNSLFSQNRADSGGGSGAALESPTLVPTAGATFRDCRFDRNGDETGANGALEITNFNVNLERCVIENCSNGAISMSRAGTLRLFDCSLLQNVYNGGSGGALLATGAVNVEIFRSRFDGNRVIGASGGALNIEQSARVRIEDSTFLNGVASAGGHIIVRSAGRLTLIRSTLRDGFASSGALLFLESGGRALLVDCRLERGQAESIGGAVQAASSQCELIRTVVSENSAGIGGALSAVGAGGQVTLISCTLRNNRSTSGLGNTLFTGGSGRLSIQNCLITGGVGPAGANNGAIAVRASASADIRHSTITGNTPGGVLIEGPGPSPQLVIANSIIWGNPGAAAIRVLGTPVIAVTHSDIEGGFAGAGNINANPLFIDPGAFRFRLQAGSPAIDAADNSAVPADAFDLDGDSDVLEPLPRDLAGRARFFDDPATADSGAGAAPLADMGAHEFQPAVRGDLNCDGAVNFDDIDAFVAALANPAQYIATFPDCELLSGDADGDLDVDFDDINGFVQCVISSGC